MTETSPLRIAFIGCGGYSRALADAAARSPLLQPAACFDMQAEAAREFESQYGVQTYTDLDSLLADGGIEGVVIATPNNAHCLAAVEAAGAGKHVFVDKPIANTLEDAAQMIAAAEAAQVTLSVGHNGRRHPGHRRMREMIDAGSIGTPVTVEANFSHSGGLRLTPDRWRYFREECPALPLMQLGVHFADTVQYLLGDVLEVSSFMSHVATPADSEDVTVSVLRFDQGLLGYLGSNYASPSVYYVNVYGTGGNLYCEGGGPLYYRRAASGDREDVPLLPVDTQREELEEFARCSRSGARCEVDGQAAMKALAVVRAALLSNDERRPVRTQDLIMAAQRTVAGNA